MIVERIIQVHLEGEERFSYRFRNEPHQVRLVRYQMGGETVTMYGARVHKNGRENTNADAILGVPLTELPSAIQEVLVS